jgi:Zn-dependent protease with chaperone function
MTAAELSSSLPREETCPQCHVLLPVYPGYVTWCDRCGWNVEPPKTESSPKYIEKIYIRLGKRLNKALFEEVCRASTLVPRLTRAKLGAYLLVFAIHVIAFLMLWLAVEIFVSADHLRLPIIVAACVLWAAWELRPRVRRPPAEALRREEYPTLYGLADKIAMQLGAPPVWAIVPTWWYQASVGRPDTWHRPVLYLGWPLLLALDDSERVAVLAHELAHTVNGDLNREWLIGRALDMLRDWYYVLRPGSLWARGMVIFVVPYYLLMSVAAGLVGQVYALLVHLLFRDGQRAEYLADYLAATVAGSETTARMLEKLLLQNTFELAVMHARADRSIAKPLDELVRLARAVPERELERRKRVDALTDRRLDLTHPPLLYRTEFVRARECPNTPALLSDEEAARLHGEIERARPSIERGLMSAASASLYY